MILSLNILIFNLVFFPLSFFIKRNSNGEMTTVVMTIINEQILFIYFLISFLSSKVKAEYAWSSAEQTIKLILLSYPVMLPLYRSFSLCVCVTLIILGSAFYFFSFWM